MASAKKTSRKGPEVPRQMVSMPERLVRAMRDRRINQTQLGELAGVSQSSISKLYNADSLDGVTAVVVARVCLGLKIPPGWLLLGEGDAIPDLSVSAAQGSSPVVVLDEKETPLVPPAPRGQAPKRARRRSR